METNFYLVEYTKDDQWEIAHGFCLISAIKRSTAKKIFQKEHSERIIKIDLLKPKKEEIIFDQECIIE